MIDSEFFGYVGAGLNIVMLVPQVFQAYKTKDTHSLSLLTIIVFILACVFWFIYGITKMAWPVILVNFIVAFINIFLLALKLKYK